MGFRWQQDHLRTACAGKLARPFREDHTERSAHEASSTAGPTLRFVAAALRNRRRNSAQRPNSTGEASSNEHARTTLGSAAGSLVGSASPSKDHHSVRCTGSLLPPPACAAPMPIVREQSHGARRRATANEQRAPTMKTSAWERERPRTAAITARALILRRSALIAVGHAEKETSGGAT